jgi:hypothetical protein
MSSSNIPINTKRMVRLSVPQNTLTLLSDSANSRRPVFFSVFSRQHAPIAEASQAGVGLPERQRGGSWIAALPLNQQNTDLR